MKDFSALLLLFFSISIFSTSAALAQSGAAAEDSRNTAGYMGSVEFGYLYGKVKNQFNNPPTYMAAPSVQLFNGYRAHRLFAIGGTVGFDFYDNILITPIALGIRGEVLNRRVSPIYSLDAGYGASFLSGKAFGERPDGGWMLNPALGFRVQTGNKAAFLFSAGYKQQRVEVESITGWGLRTNQRITYKRLSLRLGFMF
ncbi:hypothetical protein ACMA1I_17310 [Pontibacter sp. 13R65]|uniref:hypothetical protein n=1 Tax=Pontibacter sp. 13R65 TaxID=3127458 RepID=UPI00301DB207